MLKIIWPVCFEKHFLHHFSLDILSNNRIFVRANSFRKMFLFWLVDAYINVERDERSHWFLCAVASVSSRAREKASPFYTVAKFPYSRRDVIIPSLIPFNPARRSTLPPPLSYSSSLWWQVPETNCRTNNERNKIDALTSRWWDGRLADYCCICRTDSLVNCNGADNRVAGFCLTALPSSLYMWDIVKQVIPKLLV